MHLAGAMLMCRNQMPHCKFFFIFERLILAYRIKNTELLRHFHNKKTYPSFSYFCFFIPDKVSLNPHQLYLPVTKILISPFSVHKELAQLLVPRTGTKQPHVPETWPALSHCMCTPMIHQKDNHTQISCMKVFCMRSGSCILLHCFF